MNNWREVRLGKVVEFNPRVKLEKNKEYSFIGIADINANSNFVSETSIEKYTGQSSSKFENGDILFSRITPCLENRKIARAILKSSDKGFGSTEFFVFRGKKDVTRTDFIHYLVSSDIVVLPAINSMTGASGRQRADKDFVSKIKIKIPDLETQEKIADILSTYDKLIENNNKRIKILEETAEETYKEWFVRMRFPGHKNTTFEKGIPKGWEVKKVGELISFDISGGWGKDEPEGDYVEKAYVIRGTDIPNMIYSNINYELLRYHKKTNLKNRRLKEHDIIFEVSGGSANQYLGRTYYITNEILSMYDEDVICASFCKLIRLDNKYLSWFFNNYLKYARDMGILSTFEVQSTGISNFRFDNFKKHHKILVPSDKLIKEFYDLTYDIFKEINKLGKQNQNLKKQRDLLLPRLMNGTIQVK